MSFIIVIICIAINGILVAAEMSFISVRRSKLKLLANQNRRRAKLLLSMRMHPERILSVIQIGITLVGAVAAAVTGASAEENFGPWLQSTFQLKEPTADFVAVTIFVIPLTYANVVFGELVPKSISLKKPEVVALFLTPTLVAFDFIFAPFVSVLEKSTKIVLKIFSFSSGEPPPDETSGIELDLLQSQTKQYVMNLVKAESRRAEDVMIPLEEVNFIRRDESYEEIENKVFTSGHTRLPVFESENMVGLLHTKEFTNLARVGDRDWVKLIRPILKFRAGEPIFQILVKMQENRSHMAAIYQRMQVIGIITLEDIMEEVVGEIFDEDDDGKIRRLLTLNRRKSFSPKN